MCGVYCEYRFDNLDPSSDSWILSNLDKTYYRGPDNKAIFRPGSNVVMAHQRLSIIDTDERSHQPMSFGHWTIIFNGEIFNYLELANDLALENILLETSSDTEILLKYVALKGIESIYKFNGMFAFLLFDASSQTLYAVRDRFGIKPLYYVKYKDSIVFSSEVKSLAPVLTNLSPNVHYYNDYLTKTITDFDSKTHYSDISQVLPGNLMTISSDGVIQESQWYGFRDFDVDKSRLRSFESACDYFEEVLVDAIRIRLRSDVPYCLTLSGGLDSSTIFTLINEKLGLRVEPFTLVHPNVEMDESEVVARLANEYGYTLNKISATERLMDFASLKRNALKLDFPIWNNSVDSYLKIYQTIKESGYTVVLEGHGADEILGGYPFMVSAAVNTAIRKGQFLRGYRLLRVVYGMEKIELRHDRRAIGLEFIIRLIKAFRRDFQDFKSVVNSSFDKDILPIVLRAFDRLTMHNSVENRCPFLDYRIVELTRNLPEKFLIDENGSKRLLRSILHKYDKDYVSNNKQKMGFAGDIVGFFKIETNRLECLDFWNSNSGLFEEFNLKVINLPKILQSNREMSWSESVAAYKYLSALIVLKECHK